MTLRSLSKSGSVRSTSSLPSYRTNVGTSTAVDAPPPRRQEKNRDDSPQSSTDAGDDHSSALSDDSALSSSDDDEADSSTGEIPPPPPSRTSAKSSVPSKPRNSATTTTTTNDKMAATTRIESLPPASRGMTALSPWSKGLRGTKHDAAARWTRRQAQSRHHFIIVRLRVVRFFCSPFVPVLLVLRNGTGN